MSRFVLLLLLLFSWVAGAQPGVPAHVATTPPATGVVPAPSQPVAQGAPPAPFSASSTPLAQSGAAHGVEAPELASPRPQLVTGELETARFRFLYTDRSKGTAEALSQRLEAERDAFSKVLGHDWPGVIEVRIGAGRKELEALALPGGRPPAWAIALAYPSHGIILLDALQLAGPEGPVTLRHELAHVALGKLGRGWPRWFQEGLAQHLTGERISIAHYTALFHAVRSDRVLSFEDLTQSWPEHASDVQLAYAQSASFVAWISNRYGPTGLATLIDFVGQGDSFGPAFAKAFQTSLRMEEDAWRAELPSRYGWMPWVTTGSLALSVAALACVLGWMRRRRQLARRLAEMEAEDAAEDAARQQLEAELLALERQLESEEDESFPGVPTHLAPPSSSERAGEEDDGLPRRGKDTLH